MANTVRLHRVFAATPEKVFRAFTEGDALIAWLPPYGFLARLTSLNVRPGGSYHMSFINFTTGHSHSFGGEYLEVIPNERLKYTDKFDDPNLPGEMVNQITFRSVLCGTEVTIVQEGIPEMIPVEMCYLGWQDSLDKLKRLVEPDIKDAGM
jgi:uncharacterized protein YndB with AHSA1/START domain